MSRIGAHTLNPIALKLSQVVVNMPAVVLEIKKKIKIVLAGVSRKGGHTVNPIAMKLSQVVVNMPAVVLEIKKN